MYNYKSGQEHCNNRVLNALEKLNDLKQPIDVSISIEVENGKGFYLCRLTGKGIKPVEARSNIVEVACRQAVKDILKILRNEKQTRIDNRRNQNSKSKENYKNSFMPKDDGVTND